jgi:hypothetical protein
MRRVRFKPLGWLGLLSVLATTSAIGLASPGASLAASEKEYSTTVEPTCVFAPGTLNVSAKLQMTVTGMAPSELASLGQTFSLTKTSITIVAPVSVTELFAGQEANEAKGVLSNFVVNASEAEPVATNIAKPPEFPSGLPFAALVEKGKPLVLHVPSKVPGELGTYTAGTWTVSQIAASVALTVSNEPGFEEKSPGEYVVTGKGVQLTIEGLKSGTRVIGPITVACNGAGSTLAQIPHAKNSEQFEHPEMYSNNIRLGTGHVGVIDWGPLKLVAATLGEEGECVGFGFGSTWNEGSPGVGRGQVLSFGAAGDATAAGGETRRSCKFKQGTTEGLEAWVTTASALSEGKQGPPLSVPWNTALSCVEIESTPRALLEVGTPNGAPATTGCVTEAEQVAANAKEEEERRGCYATTVPEGCIKVNVVVPAAAQELVFEGTLRGIWRNGFTSGIKPSELAFQSETMGKLHLAGTFGTTATVSGGLKMPGLGTIQLMTEK